MVLHVYKRNRPFVIVPLAVVYIASHRRAAMGQGMVTSSYPHHAKLQTSPDTPPVAIISPRQKPQYLNVIAAVVLYNLAPLFNISVLF